MRLGLRRMTTSSGSLRRTGVFFNQGSRGASSQGRCVCRCSGRSQGVSLLKRLGAWVPAPLSPSRPAAHCSPYLGAGGGPTAGGASIAAPSPPGRIRRGSCHQSGSDAAAPAAGATRQACGAARDTGSPACSSGRRRPFNLQGPHAPGLSAGLLSGTAAPPVQGSCAKEQAAPSQFFREAPAPTAILLLRPRRVNGALFHHRSPHQDPNRTGRSQGWPARHH
ncbi:hypothetical protein NDU88_007119 [Pleurodeles waltl]|uniref:Uncharacterized protein n=1 Tax=Pleurodeles waltl TaxID=8319 RepID=A0AAV7PLK8_PLEWA|nr:hypothetical protein NDU88_007119 [Pleurodeles waltl]